MKKVQQNVDTKNITDFICPDSYPKEKKTFDFFKRVFDIFVSIIALSILFLPSIVISIFIYAEDKGNILYISKRLGSNGKEFNMFKFRTMKTDSDKLENSLSSDDIELYKKEYKLADDPRVTKVGRFLRITSLDEIPQFINVLIGDMSFIGPRPIVTEELDMYGENRDKLLSVKPGLTGYWQAYARNQVGYQDNKRQNMELYYVYNRSILLDIKIIFATIVRVITRKGAS